MFRSAAFWTALGSLATFVLAFLTFGLLIATRQQGRLSQKANQQSFELTVHQIDLQYKASVYRDVLAFMGQTRRTINDWHAVATSTITESTHQPPQPRDVDRDELDVFAALEFHASPEALAASSRWFNLAEECWENHNELVARDLTGEFTNSSDERRLAILNEIYAQKFKLNTLEKNFLEIAKREMRVNFDAQAPN